MGISKYINEGDKFGRLTALRLDRSEIKEFKSSQTKSGIGRNTYTYWLFKCDCGTEKSMCTRRVLNGLTKSCGCLHKESLLKVNKDKKLPEGEAMKRKLLGNYIASASKRSLEFKLTQDEFYWLVNQDCTYCGAPPLGEAKSRFSSGSYWYNGIDRSDSNKGYVFENCVPCCKFCNMAKRDYPVDEFYSWIERLRNYKRSNEL